MMILLEEEKPHKEVKRVQPKHRLVLSKSVVDFLNISPPVKKILDTAYSKIKEMKDSTNNILAQNSLYLTKTNNKFLNDNNSAQNKKTLPIIQTSHNDNENNNQHHNFIYVTDNYRKQLNQAFMRFNPGIHLENLKMLEKSDPTIKADIAQLKEMINWDLKVLTDKYYYKKKYESYLKKKPYIKLLNQVSRSRNTKTRVTTAVTTNTGDKTMPFSRRGKAITNTEQKRGFNEIKDEMNCMESSLKLMGDVIGNMNMVRDNVDVFLNNKRKPYLSQDEPYKSQFSSIEETIKNIHACKYVIENEEEKKKNWLALMTKENEAFIARLPIIKESISKEFNSLV